MLHVSEREIARAVAAFDAAGIRAEGAAAAGLAALPQLPELDGPIVLVVTGRNIDDELLSAHSLRPLRPNRFCIEGILSGCGHRTDRRASPLGRKASPRTTRSPSCARRAARSCC